MGPSEVVNQLRVLLPTFTDLFTDNISNTALSVTSGIATVTTPVDHGLATGDAITIANAITPNSIISFTKSGLNFTFKTSVSHDLTLGEQTTVTLSGFTDGDWNDTFTLQKVPNRTEFTVTSANADPVLNSNELLNEILTGGNNGIFGITVTSPTIFTFATNSRDTTSTVTIKSEPRITSVPGVDELARQYTKQPPTKFWAFVIFNAIVASKDRSVRSDRTNSRTASDDKRSQYSQTFSVFVVAPTQEQLSALDAMDICYQDLLLPFARSLVGFKPSSPLSEAGVYVVTLLGSSQAGYDVATYTHQYDFEFAFDLTNADSVDPISNQAFRDIPSTLVVGTDDPLTASTNLDEDS
ncbi:MAG: hypothetical protein QQN63_04490 [Nitrosopumilus sp.]